MNLVGNAPLLNTLITPAVGNLGLNGIAPSLVETTDRDVTPDGAVLALAGTVPQVAISTVITPSVGSLSLAGIASSTLQGLVVQPAVGTLTIVGISPAIAQSMILTPPTGILTLVGKTVTIVNPNWIIINNTQTPNWVRIAA